jgi:uncharacterized SAM-binding protein YcdF (DUF218 family)
VKKPSDFRGRLRQFVAGWQGRVVLGLLGAWLVAAGVLDNYGQRAPARGGDWDAIVVAGCRVHADGRPSVALARRTRLAVQLWKEGFAPRIVFTGGVGEGKVSEAAVAAGMARTQGVPAPAIVLEDRSTNTEENARFAREILGDGARVLVVTDSFHVYRAQRVFARHFAKAGGAGSVGMTWPRTRGAVREVGAIAWYAVNGRL